MADSDLHHDRDVTDLVQFGLNDDESLPLTKCVCGEKFRLWDFILSVYRDDPHECPRCRRRMYFRPSIRVYVVAGE